MFLLEVNGEVLFETFEQQQEQYGSYAHQLVMIHARFALRAELRNPGTGSFKQLKGKKASDTSADYEYRTKNIRVFSFQAGNGEIIVSGMVKNDAAQRQYIKWLRELKKQYFQQEQSSGIPVIPYSEDKDTENELEETLQNRHLLD
jgi:hypothetical protein